MFNKIFSFFIIIFSFLYFAGCSSPTGSGRPDVTPPAVPTNLKLYPVGNGSINLTWDKVLDKDLEGYYVYWLGGVEVDTTIANKTHVTINATTISGLDYETKYYFAISSVDKNGNESNISQQNWAIAGNLVPPEKPKGLGIVAENIEYPKITVYWTQNPEPDISYYKIYRSLSQSTLSDSTSLIAKVTSEYYSDIDIEVGKKYYYSIVAVDLGGFTSSHSDNVSDIVLPEVTLISPVNFAYVSQTPSFSWNPVTNATKYRIIVTSSRIGGEVWDMEVESTVTQLVYTGKTKLISGNRYWWKVGAISLTEINSISQMGSFVVSSSN